MERQNNILGKTVLIAAVFVMLSAPSVFALPVFSLYNGHYYEAIPGSYDWHAAQNLSQSMLLSGVSGHLATLTSAGENNWVWNNLNQPTRYLLGATDEQTEGSWKWVTGEAWNYINWNTGEPNDGFGNYPEDALSFWDNSRWNDLPILGNYWNDGIPYVYGFIVEYDFEDSMPEPATLMLFSFGLAGVGITRIRKTIVRKK